MTSQVARLLKVFTVGSSCLNWAVETSRLNAGQVSCWLVGDTEGCSRFEEVGLACRVQEVESGKAHLARGQEGIVVEHFVTARDEC